jgi:cell division protein FtsL
MSEPGAAPQPTAGSPQPTAGSPQPTAGRPRFTSRAAVLAIVVCAIALSLAYPVREFIAQHRQIDQLEVQRQQIGAELRRLRAEQRELSSPAYIERQARDDLHMCLPSQTCYVVIDGRRPASGAAVGHGAGDPWYERIWSSLRHADRKTPR